MSNHQKTSYWLDSEDVIQQVSTPTWDEFALANDGAKALSENVVGHKLRSFIVNDVTRMWVDALINLSRVTNIDVEQDYRCDSPNEKRYMKMTIRPRESGVVCIEHTLVRTEKITPCVRFEYAGETTAKNVLRCSICNLVKLNGRWYEPEIAHESDLIDAGRPVQVIYTVCEVCIMYQGLSIPT